MTDSRPESGCPLSAPRHPNPPVDLTLWEENSKTHETAPRYPNEAVDSDAPSWKHSETYALRTKRFAADKNLNYKKFIRG